MLYKSWLRLVGALSAVILCVAMVQSWRADRRDRAQLAAELAATRQLLAAADVRQHERDTQLTQTLAALAVEKRAVITPTQILRELPKNLPLPAPLILQTDHNASSVGATLGSPAATAGDAPAGGASPAPTRGALDGALIPRADLKPLYDFTLDCKACQAKLAAAQGNLADEQKKIAALAQERDDALRVAKGGSAWRRIGRAAGAVAAKLR